MKKITLLTSFILLFIFTSAQTQTSEIGIGLLRYEDYGTGYECSSLRPLSIFSLTYTNCLFVKSQRTSSLPSIFFRTTIYKNLSGRLSYHFIRTKTEFYNTFAYSGIPAYNSAQSDYHNLATGLQYNIIPQKKLSPYMIIELAHQIVDANMKYYDTQGELLPTVNNPSSYKLGLSSGLGIRFKFGKTLSASVETLFNGVKINLYPLSRLSINYHF